MNVIVLKDKRAGGSLRIRIEELAAIEARVQAGGHWLYIHAAGVIHELQFEDGVRARKLFAALRGILEQACAAARGGPAAEKVLMEYARREEDGEELAWAINPGHVRAITHDAQLEWHEVGIHTTAAIHRLDYEDGEEARKAFAVLRGILGKACAAARGGRPEDTLIEFGEQEYGALGNLTVINPAQVIGLESRQAGGLHGLIIRTGGESFCKWFARGLEAAEFEARCRKAVAGSEAGAAGGGENLPGSPAAGAARGRRRKPGKIGAAAGRRNQGAGLRPEKETVNE